MTSGRPVRLAKQSRTRSVFPRRDNGSWLWSFFSEKFWSLKLLVVQEKRGDVLKALLELRIYFSLYVFSLFLTVTLPALLPHPRGHDLAFSAIQRGVGHERSISSSCISAKRIMAVATCLHNPWIVVAQPHLSLSYAGQIFHFILSFLMSDSTIQVDYILAYFETSATGRPIYKNYLDLEKSYIQYRSIV